MPKFKILLILLLAPVVCQALTLQDIYNRARLAIGEPDSAISYYTNSELRDYGEDGRNYIESFGIGIVKENKTALVAKQETYDLPSDYLTWLSVWIKTPDSLIHLVNSNQAIVCGRFLGSWEDVRYPVEFAMYLDSQIAICPYPLNDIDTLVIKYFATSATLSADTDTCTLPYRMQLLVTNYIVAQCYWKDEKLEAYKLMVDYIDEQIAKYKANIYKKQTVPGLKEKVKNQ